MLVIERKKKTTYILAKKDWRPTQSVKSRKNTAERKQNHKNNNAPHYRYYSLPAFRPTHAPY